MVSLNLTIVHLKFNYSPTGFHENLRIYKSQAEKYNLDILINNTNPGHVQKINFDDVTIPQQRPIIVQYTKSKDIIGGRFWLHLAGKYLLLFPVILLYESSSPTIFSSRRSYTSLMALIAIFLFCQINFYSTCKTGTIVTFKASGTILKGPAGLRPPAHTLTAIFLHV